MSSNWQTNTIRPISKILCYYTNSSRTMQHIQLKNSSNFDLEKIVFPQQRILFEAIPQGKLEIYTVQTGKLSCIKIISCHNLQVNQVPQNLTSIETIALYQDKSA